MDLVGDNKRLNITGAFGVPGENDIERMVDFCVERRVVHREYVLQAQEFI